MQDEDDVVAIDEDEPSSSKFNSNEHAYSYSKLGNSTNCVELIFTPSKILLNDIPYLAVSKFHPKAQTSNGEVPLMLTTDGREQLVDLMMEGDLLEVALDETQHIWKILSNSTSPSRGIRKYSTGDESKVQSNLNLDGKEAKKRGRKRKSEEFEHMKKIPKSKIDEKSLVKRKSLPKEVKKSVTPQQTPAKRGPKKVSVVKK